MATTIRVGTASPSTQTTTASTIAHLATIARRAASQHIDILLLPEAFIGGYPRGTAFGCVIGDRSAQGRDEFVQYFEKAVDLGDTVGDGGAGAGQKWVKRELGDGETQRGDGTREKLEGIAAETGVFIVTGCVEKAGGSLYCAVVYVCPRLGMIGKRRKVMPVSSTSSKPLYPLLLSIWPIGNANNRNYVRTDRHRAPYLGSSQPQHPPCRQHHHPRYPRQPRSRHLLGKLHAARTPGSLFPKHQPLSRSYSRPSRCLAKSDADNWHRGAMFRRQQ